MNKKLLARCRELEQQLIEDDSLEADTFRDAESELHSVVSQLDLYRHPNGVPEGWREMVETLDRGIHTLALRGRLMKARYLSLKDGMAGLEEPDNEELQAQVTNLRKEVEGISDYDKAAIAVEREMHEAKGGFKDVFKALLMWRDAPEEKLKEETDSTRPAAL